MATKIITDQIQSHNGLLTLTLPVNDGAANSTLVTDGNGNLSFAAATTTSSGVVGQAFYGSGSGTYYWTCPPGVTSVCVVCIGGGEGSRGSQWSNYAGCGGGLGWKNNIDVVPGKDYLVQVGRGGDGYGGYYGTSSYFIETGLVFGGGGSGNGSGFTGDGGGSGGSSGQYGGGGAGGYTGNGGGQDASGSGGGAAGGGGYSSTHGGASGGGVGPFGQWASGYARSHAGGMGGSGGADGEIGENPWYSYGVFGARRGGLYGGGGGGTGSNAGYGGGGFNPGGRGCVRIIWGAGRKFPSTGTGDM